MTSPATTSRIPSRPIQIDLVDLACSEGASGGVGLVAETVCADASSRCEGMREFSH